MYIDSHAHLTFEAFDEDRSEVIKKAQEANVLKIINIGTQISSSQDAINLAENHKGLYASVGIHPHHVDKIKTDWETRLNTLLKHPRVVAVGECGLDKYHYHSNGTTDLNLQTEVFEKQILLAQENKLPLQIHNRLAWKELEDALIRNKKHLNNPPGVLHCFSGDKQYLKKMLELGFYIGFDGNITYKGLAKGESTHLKDLVEYTPIERILTETDSPYLTPVPHRGLRNEPKNVIIVLENIARIKKLSAQSVEETVEKNFNKLFKKAYE